MFETGDKIEIIKSNFIGEISAFYPASQMVSLPAMRENHYKVSLDGYSGILSEGLVGLLFQKQVEISPADIFEAKLEAKTKKISKKAKEEVELDGKNQD